MAKRGHTASTVLLALLFACSSSERTGNQDRAKPEQVGTRLAFALEVPPDATATREELFDQAFSVVQRRVFDLELRERPAVLKRDGFILVELAGADAGQAAEVEAAITKSHEPLRFRLAVHEHPRMMALCEAGSGAPQVAAVPEAWTSEDDRQMRDCHLEAPSRAVLEEYVGAHEEELALDGDQELVYEELPAEEGRPKPIWRTHVINRTAVLTGDHVRDAFVTHNPGSSDPCVQLEFDEAGARLQELMTGSNIGVKLIVTLGDRVLSAPVIHGRISGGAAVISLGAPDHPDHTVNAFDLVAAIRARSLPVRLRLVFRESLTTPRARRAFGVSTGSPPGTSE